MPLQLKNSSNNKNMVKSTTGQSHGVGMPVVQLTTHIKRSTLYGCPYSHKSKFLRLDGLLLPLHLMHALCLCLIMISHFVSFCILLTHNHVIFVVQIWNKQALVNFFKDHKLHEPIGLVQFG